MVVSRFLASLLIVFLLPIFAAISLVILIKMGRPIFFMQTRLGRNKKPFNIIKFRTMEIEKTSGAEFQSATLVASRITRFGQILRMTGFDELPQLINISRGDMSFVGPRPLPLGYDEVMSQAELRRFFVKPGITGLAQISGGNSLSWDRKLQLDIVYIESKSLWGDFRIVCRTFFYLVTSYLKSSHSRYSVPEDLREERKN